MPEGDEGRQPPFELHLAAWATSAAEELHREFSDNVSLTVGALPYAPDRQAQHSRAPGQAAELLDQRAVTAELDGPAVIKSGRTMRHGLLLRNFTQLALNIPTTAPVPATVPNPAT